MMAPYIKIDFFKLSGKWYATSTLPMPREEFLLDNDKLKQWIVDNQDQLRDGWQGNFKVVVEGCNLEQANEGPGFLHRLFGDYEFEHIKKTHHTVEELLDDISDRSSVVNNQYARRKIIDFVDDLLHRQVLSIVDRAEVLKDVVDIIDDWK